MENQEILMVVHNLLKEIVSGTVEIIPGSTFKDLGINSLNKVDLITMAAEELSINITSEDIIKINTVEQLVECLKNKKNDVGV